MSLDSVKKEVFVSCPFNLLVEKYIEKVLVEGINLEIGLNGTILYDYITRDFLNISSKLKEKGLCCTVHAPFTDMSIGAIDERVRVISISQLKKAVDIACIFDARAMVFHTGWEKKIYADQDERWLKNFTHSLKELCSHAKRAGIPLMLENVFELSPDLHVEIFKRFSPDEVNFCLDVGHVYAFSKKDLSFWLERVGERIGQLHLHDNKGSDDEHLAPGEGIIDFEFLFSWLSKRGIKPLITLEAHDEKTVIPGLLAIDRLKERFFI